MGDADAPAQAATAVAAAGQQLSVLLAQDRRTAKLLKLVDPSIQSKAIDVHQITDFRNLVMPRPIFVHDNHRQQVEPTYGSSDMSRIMLTSSEPTVAEGFDACGDRVVNVNLRDSDNFTFDTDFAVSCIKQGGKTCELSFVESEQFFRPKAGGYHTAKLPIPKTVAYSCRYLRFKEYEIYEWSKAATQCYITQAALTTSKGRQQQPNKEALARKLTSVQFLQLRGKLGLKNAQLVEELHYPKTRLFVQAKIPFMIANNAGLPGLADFEAAAAPTPAEVPAAAPGLLPDAQAPPAPPAPAAAAVGQPPAQAAAGPAAQAHPPLLAAAPVPAAEGAEGEAEMPAASAPAATEAPAAAAAAAIAVVAAPAQAAAAAAVTDTAVAAVDAAAALLLARIPAAPQSSRLKRCLHVEAAGAPDGSPKAPRVGSSHCSQLQPAAASEAHPAAAGQHGACR